MTKKISVEPCRVGEREKSFEKFWKRCLNKSNMSFLKKLDSRVSIDRKSILIDRNKQRLTKNFKCNFYWSKNRLDQSKFWKNSFLEKITWFLKKLLKALNIMSKMHKNEMKCFSKTQVLNPVFPKLRFSNILPLKSQTQSMFCTKKKLKVISHFVGQTERHTQ